MSLTRSLPLFVLAALTAGDLMIVMPARAESVSQAQIANRRCLNCHSQSQLPQLTAEQRRTMVAPTDAPLPARENLQALYVGDKPLDGSPHAAVSCVSCHTDAATLPHAARLGPVSCDTAGCHTMQAAAYRRGTHAARRAAGDPLAPDCASCHGGHDIFPASDPRSRTYPLNVINLCGDCHRKHTGKTPDGLTPTQIVTSYLDSVHGQAVTKAGLVVSATCVDCHGEHAVAGASSPESKINRANVPRTCGKCHEGVAAVFAKSVHGKKAAAGDMQAPVCTDCHTAHAITHAGTTGFLRDIVNECGQCHNKPRGSSHRSLYDTYRLSYHGQVMQLGSTRGAMCSDCHGAHDILPVDDAASRLNGANRIRTCRRCHEEANANFAMFEPHADYRDGENYPLLHYVWLYFMLVMGVTFTFFGLHTVLWFMRAIIHHFRNGKPKHHHAGGRSIQRFKRIDRVNHALIIVTFFGLTITGMPLLFSDQPWAAVVARLCGGVHMAGILHRIFALMLLGNFAVHFAGVINRCRKHGVRHVIFGPNSMLPRWRDVTDMLGMFRWFVGGPKPTFDRWTYWEKFDYWAEIFGTSVIGGTGLMLWFPEFFSQFLPGWIFNAATIVHGYEAMLAVGFIFTIHFFNAHLRPEKFPVDDVMFTGQLPEAEFMEERGDEYERLKASGDLEKFVVEPAGKWQRPLAVVGGIVALLIGTLIVVLIIIGGIKSL